MIIATSNISKTYGLSQALAPLTIEFADGNTTVLIGPSGCGKSTLLRILIKLIEPDTGEIKFEGSTITEDNVEGIRRKIGYVIQDGGLFPHLTARQNITLLADFIGLPKSDSNRRVTELANLVQIPESLLGRFPSALSGGQRQRISLMRALMLDPKVILLDEPLGALDPITRRELQVQLKEIFVRLQKTTILVTHDMGEAAYFGDEIVLMKSGTVIQRGTFDDLLHKPSDPYVTSFIRAQRSPFPENGAEE